MSRIRIAVGRSRTDTRWRNTETDWETLSERLSRPVRTDETAAQYRAMGRAARGAVKDVGGFVGGELAADGPRKAANVRARTLLTLDIDFGTADTEDRVRKALGGVRWCLYSTHSHTAGEPRYRLVAPLSRPVSPDEYVPLARKVAEAVGMALFDGSTYEPSRLMYWPSCPADGAFVFRRGEGADLDADAWLARYVDWRDPAGWPVSDREGKAAAARGGKNADPTAKPGIVGAFCRCYGIAAAIEEFLPDVYVPTGTPGRYTYAGGSTEGGLVVYGDRWAYSHHGSDPLCGREVNSFDLVRLHLFGDMDAGTAPETPVNRTPSYLAMAERAEGDPKVRRLVIAERQKAAEEEFAGCGEEDREWLYSPELKRDRKGGILPTVSNFTFICTHDPKLRDTVRHDVFEDRDRLVRDLPWAAVTGEHATWTDSDDLGLLDYVSRVYGLTAKQPLLDAHDLVMSRTAYHPVRDYLGALEWDGTPRLDTLLADFLGAEDTPLARAMTRKHLTAAVARVMDPGVKYDYVLTIVGPEGIGKSTLLRKLGGRWFDDSFSSADIGDKQAMEQVRGRWLIEMGELKDYKRSSVEAFKAFISKCEDKYRPAYGRKVGVFPRQCVFFATTNETAFLKGDTGNRRFWVVEAGRDLPTKDVFALSEAEVGQIWAEALVRYRQGEKLYLDAELEAQARRGQAEHNESADDDRPGLIGAWLREPLPAVWPQLSREQRAEWFRSGNRASGEGSFRRRYVCVAEVANECLRRPVNRYEAREIGAILSELGLPKCGPGHISDATYGSQRRYQVPKEFYATSDEVA